jgi:hypothetical protein
MGIASAFARCATADEVAAPILRVAMTMKTIDLFPLSAAQRTWSDLLLGRPGRPPFSDIPRYSLGRTVKFILALIALARTADDRTITVCHNDSNSLMILVASFTPKADDA